VVECDLAKVEVAGSNPVSRSRIPLSRVRLGAAFFALARGLCLDGLFRFKTLLLVMPGAVPKW
jgi:hypothetical protein